MRILKFTTLAAAFAFSIAGLLGYSTTASTPVFSSAPDGAAVFNNKCALCHEKMARGRLTGEPRASPISGIRTGRKGAPTLRSPTL